MDGRDKKDLQTDGSGMHLCTYMWDTCAATVHIDALHKPPHGAFGAVI